MPLNLDGFEVEVFRSRVFRGFRAGSFGLGLVENGFQ